MALKPIDIYEQVTKQVRYWTMYHIIYQYDASHLIIADRFFINFLQQVDTKVLKCQTATPDDYTSSITDDIKKVLVLCQAGELALVKNIQAEYPGLHVTSGTYGYMLTSRDRYPRLVKFERHVPAPKPALKPVIFLTTPYADGEFVAKLMSQNGLPAPHEYLARPFAAWLQVHKGFQISRFQRYAEARYGKGGAFYQLLQTDVLDSLFKNTAFSLSRFMRYLERSRAKVVVVKRRDTLMQAITSQLLGRTAERSVWTKTPSKKLHTPAIAGDVLASFQHMAALDGANELIDTVKAAHVECLQVTFEDIVAEQEVGLQKIAAFLGVDLPDMIEKIPYIDGYKTAEGLHPSAEAIRYEMLDRLGLHVSEAEVSS